MTTDHKEVQDIVDRHQAACNKNLENVFGNINGSLNSLHNKMDSIVTTVNKAAIDNAKLEERLEAGRRHFERIDASIKDLQEEDKSIWKTIGKVAIWIAAGAGGGVGFAKYFGGC